MLYNNPMMKYDSQGGGVFEKIKRKNISIKIKEKNDSGRSIIAGGGSTNFKHDFLCFV